MTIAALMRVIPPPSEPFEAFTGSWDRIETALGTTLPPDYKDLVRLYGSGYWLEFFGLAIPGSQNRNVRFEAFVPTACKGIAVLDDLPFAVWPAPGGVIPFGTTDNGDFLVWVRRTDPADWGVGVWNPDFDEFEVFDQDLSGFIAGLAKGELLPKAFPEDLLPVDCLFRPNAPLT